MNTKLSNLFINSFEFDHQILVFTETWLNKKTLNTEIFCSKYNIYRLDRDTTTFGGGVLIAVSCLFTSEAIVINNEHNIEFIGVRVKLKHKQIYLTCSYIPPKSDQVLYNQHYENIKSVVTLAKPDDSVFIFGDFNLPTVSWKFLPDSFFYTPTNSDDWIDVFLNNLSDLCLFQLNGILNDNGKLLDLVFANEPTECFLTRADPISTPEDRYHPTIELSFNTPFLHKSKSSSKNNKVFCFKKTNYTDLNFFLNNTNWLEKLSVINGNSTSIDNMIDTFYKTVLEYLNECVPKVTVFEPSGPPWGSRQLSRLKNIKNKRYKKYKESGSTDDYGKYSISRAEYILLNTKLYTDYLNNIKLNFKRDPKSFYKFVNSKRKSSGYPNIMKYLSRESSNDLSICNMFADFFATTYSDAQYNNSNRYPFPIEEHQPISFPLINTSQIVTCLKGVKFSFHSGPDGVPSCILKNCAQAFAAPLSIMFNLSIKYGYFPQLWKESYIIPLFKSGNKSNVTNYRGIAKLSAIPKLFEKCISAYLCHQASSLLSPFQHGFRKGCSAMTNLLQLTSSINCGFNKGQTTDVVYTDFSKAFDKVNHNLLLRKLYLMGFTHNCLCWLESYLVCRKQSVRLNNSTSKSIIVNSGVPQGSHLGPILFSLFINDLPNVIECCNVLMYADDVKIFLSYNESSDMFNLQQDLNKFHMWCNFNLMELNLKKCKHMRFSRKWSSLGLYTLGDCQLELVKEILDLGILLDPKLNFISHITMMINKARGVLAFIKRWAKEFTDPMITKQLYTSLVRPITEYGSIIWDPASNVHSNRIESVQKQFLLFCLGNSTWNPAVALPSYTTRLDRIKLPTLESRRKMLNVTFLFNLLNGDVCSDFLLSNINFNIPQRSTRNFIPLYLQVFQTNYANADPFRRICKDFNEMYDFVDFGVNVSIIKRNIILFLNT